MCVYIYIKGKKKYSASIIVNIYISSNLIRKSIPDEGKKQKYYRKVGLYLKHHNLSKTHYHVSDKRRRDLSFCPGLVAY